MYQEYTGPLKVQFVDQKLIILFTLNNWTPQLFTILGPAVQNLKKLLAKAMLQFLSWNMANTVIFLAEKMWVAFAKATHIFSAKNITVSENTLATTVNKFVINWGAY